MVFARGRSSLNKTNEVPINDRLVFVDISIPGYLLSVDHPSLPSIHSTTLTTGQKKDSIDLGRDSKLWPASHAFFLNFSLSFCFLSLSFRKSFLYYLFSISSRIPFTAVDSSSVIHTKKNKKNKIRNISIIFTYSYK